MQQSSPQHFSIFRMLFGSYLCVHFLQLTPYAEELFGTQGIFSSHNPSPYKGIWPNPLFLEIDFLATSLITSAALLSVCLILGVWRRTSALLLWFITTCLFTANPLIANPSLGDIGLLLLFLVIAPTGESFTLKKQTLKDWKLPFMIPVTAWILLGLGYTFLGVMKLESPSWVDGSALNHVLENPLARPSFLRSLLLNLPTDFLKILTWGTLLLELTYLPLIFFKKVRPWLWLSAVLMHLGIMLVIDFADLSLGMLMIHLFTFDPDWLKLIPNRKQTHETL